MAPSAVCSQHLESFCACMGEGRAIDTGDQRRRLDAQKSKDAGSRTRMLSTECPSVNAKSPIRAGRGTCHDHVDTPLDKRDTPGKREVWAKEGSLRKVIIRHPKGVETRSRETSRASPPQAGHHSDYRMNSTHRDRVDQQIDKPC